jgi:predicted acyltransferase
MHHVEWAGFRFYDLVFPLFLFVVGVVIPYSLSRRKSRGQSNIRIFGHILKRGLLLIIMGMVLNGLLGFNFSEMRWAGVLQRIGLCYFLAALIVMFTSRKVQVLLFFVILFGYWAAMMFIPVPDYGPGVITAEGCLSSYIDRLMLPGTLYYGHGDNEGLLSTLGAVATVLMGVLAGHWLRTDKDSHLKAFSLGVAGLVSLLAGYQWGVYFPVVKIVWTSSFVLVAGGWSLLLLALFYWLMDVQEYRKLGYFFIVIGANAITIYFLQGVVDFGGIAGFFAGGLAGLMGVYGVLFMAISVLVVKWLFLWVMYRHKVLLKL